LIIATPPIKPDQRLSNLLAGSSALRKLLFYISKVPGAEWLSEYKFEFAINGAGRRVR